MTTDLRHFLQHPLTTDLHVVTLLRVMMSLVVIVPSTVVPSRSTTHMSIATSCSYYSWDFCISVVITTSSFWLNSLYWSVLSYPWSFLSKCVLVIVKDCTHTIDFYCETLCRQTSCLLVHNMYIVCAVIFPCCNYQSSLSAHTVLILTILMMICQYPCCMSFWTRDITVINVWRLLTNLLSWGSIYTCVYFVRVNPHLCKNLQMVAMLASVPPFCNSWRISCR